MKNEKYMWLSIAFLALCVVLFGVVEIPSMRISYEKDVLRTSRYIDKKMEEIENRTAYLLKCYEGFDGYESIRK